MSAPTRIVVPSRFAGVEVLRERLPTEAYRLQLVDPARQQVANAGPLPAPEPLAGGAVALVEIVSDCWRVLADGDAMWRFTDLIRDGLFAALVAAGVEWVTWTYDNRSPGLSAGFRALSERQQRHILRQAAGCADIAEGVVRIEPAEGLARRHPSLTPLTPDLAARLDALDLAEAAFRQSVAGWYTESWVELFHSLRTMPLALRNGNIDRAESCAFWRLGLPDLGLDDS